MIGKVARGGNIPFGFAVEAGMLVEDTEEQSVLATIRQLRSKGLSLRAVATDLNDQGISRRNGRAWHHVAVKRALAA